MLSSTECVQIVYTSRLARANTGAIRFQRVCYRAEQIGMNGRVRFEHAAIEDFASYEMFDAVLGRYVLVHLADPASALRRVADVVRPGGLLVFHELAIDPSSWGSFPEATLWNWAYGLFAAAVSSAGVFPDFGKRLVRTFLDAGLPRPTMTAAAPVGGRRFRLIPFSVVGGVATIRSSSH